MKSYENGNKASYTHTRAHTHMNTHMHTYTHTHTHSHTPTLLLLGKRASFLVLTSSGLLERRFTKPEWLVSIG